MSALRMRLGEWIALAGAVGLLVLLFLPWFGLEQGRAQDQTSEGFAQYAATVLEKSGWSGLGWAGAAIAALLVVGGLMVALTAALRQTPAWMVGSAVASITLGLLGALILAARIVVFQPDLGVGLPNHMVDVQLPALLGLLCAALVPAGAWVALADERVDAPESAYTPPPARPVPGSPAAP